MKFNNKTYDILKYIALIGLPAIAYLVGQLGEIYGLTDSSKMVMAINAVSVTLGMLLQVSNYNYKKEESKKVQ